MNEIKLETLPFAEKAHRSMIGSEISIVVRNNPDKFPAPYMFVLNLEERDLLRSKFRPQNFRQSRRRCRKSFPKKVFTYWQRSLKAPLPRQRPLPSLKPLRQKVQLSGND